jgi:hypothetical protein
MPSALDERSSRPILANVQPHLAVFAELLVTGIQASVWVALLAATVFGTRWISVEVSSGVEVVLAVIALAFVYALGILIDRVADWAFRPFDKSLRGKDRDQPTEWRLEVLAQYPELAKDLAYARSRSRIARATSLNVLLITAAGLVFVLARTSLSTSGGTWRVVVGVFLGLGLTVVAFYAWRSITRNQYRQIKKMHSLVQRLRRLP